jgi:hypothetical protein
MEHYDCCEEFFDALSGNESRKKDRVTVVVVLGSQSAIFRDRGMKCVE